MLKKESTVEGRDDGSYPNKQTGNGVDYYHLTSFEPLGSGCDGGFRVGVGSLLTDSFSHFSTNSVHLRI